jgi:hypothetical protein
MPTTSERLATCPVDRASLDDRRRERRGHAHLFVALAIGAGTVFGCGDGRDDLESVQAPLYQTFNVVGGTQRIGSKTCQTVCLRAVQTLPGPPGSGIGGSLQCVQYGPNCNLPGSAGGLYADYASYTSGALFGAYNDPTWEYDGCGPQAAQNVLNYYGVQMPIDQVTNYISTFGLIAGDHNQNIATFPDDLASGLQNLLGDQVSAHHFVVSRRSGVDVSTEIPNAIDHGYPLIMLVNGGDHYQVATGYRPGGVYVIDYAGDDQWRGQGDLGMQLSTGASIFSTISFGAGGYEDYTVISLQYTNNGVNYDPPSSTVAATQCTVGGYSMHCCPNGYAMVGADPNANVFKCAAIDVPGKLGPPTLDTGTQRNNMHSCPPNQVMVGLRVDWNLLACQALPAGSVNGERVDSTTRDTRPMHTCQAGSPYTQAMTGIRVDQNLLACATATRLH